jgi:hypothetical protein
MNDYELSMKRKGKILSLARTGISRKS